jgi:transcriptional regulator with XRE-family HTH domain
MRSQVGTTAEVIKELRRLAGLSREEFAQAAGISSVFLNKIEQGTRQPSPKTLARIAQVLGVSTEDLSMRAALLEASDAPTEAEMQRRLLRAAAISGAAAGAIVKSLLPAGPFAYAAGAALGATVARHRVQAGGRAGQAADVVQPDDRSGIVDPDELRRGLISEIAAWPEDQLPALAAAIDSAKSANPQPSR